MKIKKYKNGVRQYKHPEKNHTRDIWVLETWKYNGGGYHVVKKKLIPRKQKYKKLPEE